MTPPAKADLPAPPGVGCSDLLDHVFLITLHQSVSGESQSGQPTSLVEKTNQLLSDSPSADPLVKCKARHNMPETKCPDCRCHPDCGRCSCPAMTELHTKQYKLRCMPT